MQLRGLTSLQNQQNQQILVDGFDIRLLVMFVATIRAMGTQYNVGGKGETPSSRGAGGGALSTHPVVYAFKILKAQTGSNQKSAFRTRIPIKMQFELVRITFEPFQKCTFYTRISIKSAVRTGSNHFRVGSNMCF